jgi:hypothetical protein
MLSVANKHCMLSIVMLNVIILSVVILNGMEPFLQRQIDLIPTRAKFDVVL